MNPSDIVRTGYDRLGDSYHAYFAGLHAADYSEWIRLFERLVPLGSKILELGCADGRPVAAALAPHYDYTGVDLSPVQIERARVYVPKGNFTVADMTELQLPPKTFAGAIALYSIIHVPLEKQPGLLRDIFGWLIDGGVFMAVLGAGRWTGTEDDWVLPGTRMYWSHTSADEYARWLRLAGFDLLNQRYVPEGKAGHTFVMARKPHQRAEPTPDSRVPIGTVSAD